MFREREAGCNIRTAGSRIIEVHQMILNVPNNVCAMICC
jgi:hypothetical protein